MGAMQRPLQQANAFENGQRSALFPARPRQQRRQPWVMALPANQHVVQHTGAADQVVLLEQHACLTPVLVERRARLQSSDARHMDLAGGGHDKAVKRVQQGRLAGRAAGASTIQASSPPASGRARTPATRLARTAARAAEASWGQAQ